MKRLVSSCTGKFVSTRVKSKDAGHLSRYKVGEPRDERVKILGEILHWKVRQHMIERVDSSSGLSLAGNACNIFLAPAVLHGCVTGFQYHPFSK